jgi:hypothetical protein
MHFMYFPAFVIFTDQAQFTRDGVQNVHSQYPWADGTPVNLPSHHQRLSLIISTGVCGYNLFGPHVLPNSLTGRNYKALLENRKPDSLAGLALIFRQELNSCTFQEPESNISWTVGRCRSTNCLASTLPLVKSTGFLFAGPFKIVGVFVFSG